MTLTWLERMEHAVFPVVRSWAEGVLATALHWVRQGASHTGLPVIVVAALALVFAWRVARRTWHIAFELAVAVGLLFLATHMGWIRW